VYIISCAYQQNIYTFEWRPFDYVAIDHKSLTVREQWENYIIITVRKLYNN